MAVNRPAFLYPGQGSQRAGMIAALPPTSATRRVLDEASDALGGLGYLDTADGLASTRNAQLALLICGVAATRTLDEVYGVPPGVTAGHSAGAFAAAVAAGVLTFHEALDAVGVRAAAMEAACAPGEWGMAAVTGMGQRAAGALVAEARATVWIANINAADQVVLGGTVDGLRDARAAARRMGARRFEMLDVAVASHGPVQARTATVIAERLAAVPRRHQSAAYLTNVGARRIVDDADAVLRDLAESVAKPVQWYDIAQVLPELGVQRTVEMPPGHVLTSLLAAVPVTATSVDDVGYAAISA